MASGALSAKDAPATPLRVVSVSGGKDSLACAILALNLHPRDEIRLVFADTGNEHETTYRYVHEYLPEALGLPVHTVRADLTDRWWHRRNFILTRWPDKLQADQGMTPAEAWAVVARALRVFDAGPTGNPFLDLCVIKGRFPSRMAQFCTQYLKTEPLMSWTLDLLEHREVESWQGVRADESAWRANLPPREDRGGGYSIFRPILRWTAQMVIDFARLSGLQHNPLYAQGCDRVGCMPCINSNKAELANIARRWPEVIDRIREWERICSTAAKPGGSGFIAAPDAAGRGARQGKGIDAVIEWSRTKRGGKVLDETKLDGPACASSYGLCE